VRLLLFIRTASSRQQDGGKKRRLRQISMSARVIAIKFLILYHNAVEVKIIFHFAEKYFFAARYRKAPGYWTVTGRFSILRGISGLTAL